MIESQTNRERNRKNPSYHSNQRHFFQKQENLWKALNLSEDEKDGKQYASQEFRNLADRYSLVKRSMSRKGNCCDNALAESFFKNQNMEWVCQRKYRSGMQAALSVFEYFESRENSPEEGNITGLVGNNSHI